MVIEIVWYTKRSINGEKMCTSSNGIYVNYIDCGMSLCILLQLDRPHASIVIRFIIVDIPVDQSA